MLRRPRRNRYSAARRSLVREPKLDVSQLVYPLFVIDGVNIKDEIPSLPGNFRMSVDHILKEVEDCMKSGLTSFILFPVVDDAMKDKRATYGCKFDNFYVQACKKIKKIFPNVCLISDVAMDPYSSDGHDGLVKNGKILNDGTLEILAKMALVQAQAGFDYIGPSDMMDGRVEYIRTVLDSKGYSNTGIMSYTAKYASAYYGPFRDALDSAPKAGDKKTYQMDVHNRSEALIEAELDIQEGADIIMVKPALHYLDIISDFKANTDIPVAAYHVSGECAMLIAACKNHWLDYMTAMPEVLTSISRAGADIIITYFAKDYAQLRKSQLIK
ncbi:MAG: porphobilinogen synthase [Bacteroidia bacterium]|nr:porphobilinogen synthase [Bacteroidia bacterium]